MHKTLAKTLLAAAALAAFAAGLSQTAHAGAYADALIVAAPGHNGPRDAFTDGAHRPATEATMLPVVAQQGRSVCVVRGFDPYRDGMRKPDPYTDGGRVGSRDGFTDGARSDARDGGECRS
ncbi:hypothetical protein LMG31506_06077 [Cupriavidus yeoncheonensis]|uniref:Uncharacterized protein n=1 Tax=Cupriavidus yeoncheonensis TaxID=1462994 RepID=A0A916N7S7_9BURK|nr:hypothetical protein [Cupriavidus yeoncheonensis]CAG2157650.1 hypothetical protein LMG31506_06077 [Cupriavidus yeoncheonensis]